MLRAATEPKVIYPEKGTSPEHEVQVCHHVSKGQEKTFLEWYKIDAEMKEKYMDDMRHVEEIKRLEAQEYDYHEFIIKSTG